MIIDSHVHIGKLGQKLYTPELLISSMDEAGIDYSLLIANDLSGVNEDLAGITTDQTIKIAARFTRLKPIGSIDVKTLDQAEINKIIIYLKTGKIFGVKVYLGYQEFQTLNSRLAPLYEYCQANNKPVIFHTGVLLKGSRGKLKDSQPLNLDETANKFPALKIVMAHFGNPWIMDAAAVVAQHKNVYVDLSGYFSEMVAPIAKEEIDLFKKQLSEFKIFTGGFDKCLFGTDWPLYSQKEYLDAVKNLSMTKQEEELVFWQNAKNIFNLNI